MRILMSSKEPKHRKILKALKDMRTYLPPVLEERKSVQPGRLRVPDFASFN